MENESECSYLYRLGYIYRKYWEETIYGKTNEVPEYFLLLFI